jgi:hypothetical protein
MRTAHGVAFARARKGSLHPDTYHPNKLLKFWRWVWAGIRAIFDAIFYGAPGFRSGFMVRRTPVRGHAVRRECGTLQGAASSRGGGGLAVPSTVIHYPGLHPLGVGSDPFASGARPVQFWVVTGPPALRRSVVT